MNLMYIDSLSAGKYTSSAPHTMVVQSSVKLEETVAAFIFCGTSLDFSPSKCWTYVICLIVSPPYRDAIVYCGVGSSWVNRPLVRVKKCKCTRRGEGGLRGWLNL